MTFKKIMTFTSRVFVLPLALFLPFNLIADERWYSKTQVEKGKIVFDMNCAICHGAEASGTTDWREPLADGRYPAPPLNGTAHSWHHPQDALRLQIKQGGAQLGGWMPPMRQSLTDEQVDEVIAYFQSLWSDEIYSAWLTRFPAVSNLTSDKSLAGELNNSKDSGLSETNRNPELIAKPSPNNILRHLTSRLPNAKFGEPEAMPLIGIYRLSMDKNIIYVSSDGRYVFLGDMVDLVSGRNFSKKGVP